MPVVVHRRHERMMVIKLHNKHHTLVYVVLFMSQPQHGTYLVPQLWTRVIPNGIPQAIIRPGSDSVAIMQARNSRRNQSTTTELRTVGKVHEFRIHQVVRDLPNCIMVRSIVQFQVRKRVANQAKGIAVSGVDEEDCQGINEDAVGSPVCGDNAGPQIHAGAQRLDEFEFRGLVPGGEDWIHAAGFLGACVCVIVDQVAVSVEAELGEVVAAVW